MNGFKILDLLTEQVQLYQQLLTEQEAKIQLFVEGDLERIEDSLITEESLLEQLRACQAALRERLQGRSFSGVLEDLEEPLKGQLESVVREYGLVCQNLNRANVRNYRYLQTSLSFTQALLQEMFRASTNYNESGYLTPGGSAVQRTRTHY